MQLHQRWAGHKPGQWNSAPLTLGQLISSGRQVHARGIDPGFLGRESGATSACVEILPWHTFELCQPEFLFLSEARKPVPSLQKCPHLGVWSFVLHWSGLDMFLHSTFLLLQLSTFLWKDIYCPSQHKSHSPSCSGTLWVLPRPQHCIA